MGLGGPEEAQRLHLWPPKLVKRGDQRKHSAFTSGHRRQAKSMVQQMHNGADQRKLGVFTSCRSRMLAAKGSLQAPGLRSLMGATVAPDTH